jgi:hypothetical protein
MVRDHREARDPRAGRVMTLPLSLTVIAVPVLTLVAMAIAPVVERVKDHFGKSEDVDLFAPQEGP